MKERLFISLFLLFVLRVQDISCQQATPVLEESYWNTPSSYHFHYLPMALRRSEAPCPRISGSMGHVSAAITCSDEISKCYEGKAGEYDLLHTPIDTNLESLMEKMGDLFQGANLFTSGYDDGTDAAYTLFLSCLNGPHVDDAEQGSAWEAFKKIPNRSPKKPIAYIQLHWGDQQIDFEINRWEYSSARTNFLFGYLTQMESSAASLVRFSDSKSEALYWECLGDFWGSFGFIGQSCAKYMRASSYAAKIMNDSTKAVFLERIHEKVVEICKVDNEQNRTFGTLGIGFAQALCQPTPILEFGVHNKIVYNDFMESIYNPSDRYDLTEELACVFEGGHRETLKVDIAGLLYAFSRSDWAPKDDLARKTSMVLINYIIQNNLGCQEGWHVLNNLFRIYLDSHQYEQAETISRHLLSLSTVEGDYYYCCHYIQQAQIYLSKGKPDSAMDALHKTDMTVIALKDYGSFFDILTSRQSVLKDIAIAKNDAGQLSDIVELTEWPFPDRTDEFGSTVRFLINTERDMRDTMMQKKSDSILNAEDKIIRIEKQGRAKDSIILRFTTEKMIADSIAEHKKERDMEDADTRKDLWVIAGIAALIVIGGFGFMLYRSRRKSEKSKLLSENSQLELESLKVAYLGHSIGESFQFITNKIDKSFEDSSYLKAALRLTKGLSRLFEDFSTNYTPLRTLSQEVISNEKYVKVISEGEGNVVECRHIFYSKIADSIVVPSYFLLDIYLNSVKHGRLAKKKDGAIKATLISDKNTANIHYLTIEDNGVGRVEAEKNKKAGDKSTGIARVSRRLELFNLEKRGLSIIFDRERDITDVLGSGNQINGTRITFKIVLNENNKHPNRRES